MAFQDKYYSHDAPSDPRQALASVYAGSIGLFTIAKIQVRAHYTLLLGGLLLVLPLGPYFPLAHRLACMAMLAALVLLHELAHGIAAKGAGGTAEPVVLWPLGGLGDLGATRQPWPAFLAFLAGPALNAIICGACAAALYLMHRIVVPVSPQASFAAPGLTPREPAFYLWYLYAVSFALLALNLLPAFPLDGGHILQTMLWPFVGYGRSLLAACNAGIAVSAFLATYAAVVGQWLLLSVMVMCLIYSVRRHLVIKAAGTWTFDEFDTDLRRSRRRRHKLSRYRKWRARRQIKLEESDQSRLDGILGKIHDRGLSALSWAEKRVLRRATERQRRSEIP